MSSRLVFREWFEAVEGIRMKESEVKCEIRGEDVKNEDALKAHLLAEHTELAAAKTTNR